MLHFNIYKYGLSKICSTILLLAFAINSGLWLGDVLILFRTRTNYKRNKPYTLGGADGKKIILAYADEIVNLGNTKQDVTQTMYELLVASERMRVHINEEKNKFMILSKEVNNLSN